MLSCNLSKQIVHDGLIRWCIFVPFSVVLELVFLNGLLYLSSQLFEFVISHFVVFKSATTKVTTIGKFKTFVFKAQYLGLI